MFELFLLYLSLFHHLFSVLALQKTSFVQSAFFHPKETLSSPVKTAMRLTEGKQQTGQRVVTGRPAESRKDGQGSSLLTPTFFICSFLMPFLFSSEMSISDSQLYLCSAITLLFKWQDGMEHVSGRKIPTVKLKQDSARVFCFKA